MCTVFSSGHCQAESSVHPRPPPKHARRAVWSDKGGCRTGVPQGNTHFPFLTFPLTCHIPSHMPHLSHATPPHMPCLLTYPTPSHPPPLLTGGPETARVWECVLPGCQGVCQQYVQCPYLGMVEDGPIVSLPPGQAWCRGGGLAGVLCARDSSVQCTQGSEDAHPPLPVEEDQEHLFCCEWLES